MYFFSVEHVEVPVGVPDVTVGVADLHVGVANIPVGIPDSHSQHLLNPALGIPHVQFFNENNQVSILEL